MLNREQEIPAAKLSVVQYVVLAVLLVLIAGLWRLQIVGKDNYRALAQANRVRKVPILAPRGRLLDREGRLIVDNYPSVSAFLVHEQGRDLDADLPVIARGLNMGIDQIQAAIKKYGISAKYQPIPLKQDITPDEQEFIEAHRDALPELELINEQRRLYPRDGFAAHLIGYVGEVSEDMLQQSQYAYYEPGDVVGRSGVEETYDQLLRGTDGSHDVLVDSHGREVGVLGNEPAVPGKDLKLSVDLDIQRAAENAMGDRNGAMIAMDPHTGEILAMVSRPVFDPNRFAVRIGRDDWNKLMTDPNHPLLNKAIQAQLAPGSTFKVIMSVAGLEENVAQTLKVNCQGGASFYGRFFACDAHHGNVDIRNALPFSCDTYYYTLAQRLGITKIADWAHKMGIGKKTGIDLPNEVAGTMPSEEWAMRNYHRKWYAGETISVGIGQGAVALTPIQLARAIGGITSGGDFQRPHVVMSNQLPAQYEQAMLESFPGSGATEVRLDPAAWQTITDGMADTTTGSGTAHASHLEGIDFAGKTGTAQVLNHSFGAKSVSSNIAGRANAWFVGVAPRRNPDIVVVVLWEHGGWGAGSAHLAAQVIETFVDKQRRLEHNLQAPPKAAPLVEVGAIYSAPGEQDGAANNKPSAKSLSTPVGPAEKPAPPAGSPTAGMHGGHFFVPVHPWNAARAASVAATVPTRKPSSRQSAPQEGLAMAASLHAPVIGVPAR
ncbi:penicillin-binding protein 2 [Acidipila sp. EB88]|uniref:penicillin-binding protein 2 n=1 Tax=Acidipila sp. EB88 TaxID=2305226 RepID=UPI000F5FDB6D|nr:penicillin-binding protein 2 [Acidipila sp. EB88]RRA48768.1 penicillin-binding protein 2 [Acidipila sp. EB88]